MSKYESILEQSRVLEAALVKLWNDVGDALAFHKSETQDEEYTLIALQEVLAHDVDKLTYFNEMVVRRQ